MVENKHKEFGNIYQFPQRKSVGSTAHRNPPLVDEARPRFDAEGKYAQVEYAQVEFGDGWYHGAAIQETRHNPGSPLTRTRN